MEHSFWHERWEAGRIGFHVNRPNPLMVAHISALSLAAGSRVFVPLCGKTLDIGWLLSRGYRVVGAELSELAIAQLFEELNVAPSIADHGSFKLYSGENIEIFVGDIFALKAEMLGAVDAILDRAALIALPEAVRAAYAGHLVVLCNAAPQLLVCLEYDQDLIDGPPFSVGADEVHRHYAGAYEISGLENRAVAGGLKGAAAMESVFLLTPREIQIPANSV